MDYIYIFLILKLKCTCFDSDCSDSTEECDNSLWNYNKWYNNVDRTISSQDLSIQMYSKPVIMPRTRSIPQNMHFYIEEEASCIVQKLDQPLSFKELIKKDLENKTHLSGTFLKNKKTNISVRRAKSDLPARSIREKPKKVDYNTFIQRNKAFLASFNTSSHEHTFPLEKTNSITQALNMMNINERRVKRQINTRSYNLESIQENEDKFYTETSNGANEKFAHNVFSESNSQNDNLETKIIIHSQPLPHTNVRHSAPDCSEIIKSIKHCHIKDPTPSTCDDLHTIEGISPSSNEEGQIINVDTLKKINFNEFQKKMKKLEKDKEKVLKKHKKSIIPSIMRKRNEQKQFHDIKVKSSSQEGYSGFEDKTTKSNHNLHVGNILRSVLSLKSLVSDAAKKRKPGGFSCIRRPKKSKNFRDSTSIVHVETRPLKKIHEDSFSDTVIRLNYSSSDERFFAKNPFENSKGLPSSESDLEEKNQNLAEGITKPINYKKEKKSFDYLDMDDLYYTLCKQKTLIPPPKPKRTFEYDKYIKSLEKSEDPK